MNGADISGLVSLYIHKWIVICLFNINERVSGSYRLFVSNLRFLHLGADSSASQWM
jgi:hypothetical protein